MNPLWECVPDNLGGRRLFQKASRKNRAIRETNTIT